MKRKLPLSPDPRKNATRKQILCATDFSVHAAQAANAAAAMARRLRNPLLLAHVLDLAAFPNESEAVFAKLRLSTRKRLDQEAARLRALGAKVTVELLEGRPEEQLARLARRPESRMLVMASLGQIAVSHLLIGSVAERTAESAPIPTLIIRDEKPFVEWSQGRSPLKVFLAVDFTASSEAAMSWVRELRRIGPCVIVAGHVDWPPEVRSRLGQPGSGLVAHPPAAVRHALERDLKAKLKEVLCDTSADLRVEAGWGAPQFNLIEMAQQERADLFLLGTHQRHGWERIFQPSVSRAVLRHAPMSVACVPSCAGGGAGSVPEYHRVLATTDFSDLGNRAVPSAYSVLSHGGIVRLVHVVAPPERPGPLTPPRSKRFAKGAREKLLENHLQKLRALIPEAANARGVNTEVAVIQGPDAGLAICQEAERFGADLIVAGSHGRSGLAAALLGSVAQKIVSHSRRPVLVVRGPAA